MEITFDNLKEISDMPDILMSSLPNRVLPIIFVVDTSGSMMGERIAEVHEGIRESIDLLREYQDTVPGLRIGVAVLAFDSSSKWIVDKIR